MGYGISSGSAKKQLTQPYYITCSPDSYVNIRSSGDLGDKNRIGRATRGMEIVDISSTGDMNWKSVTFKNGDKGYVYADYITDQKPQSAEDVYGTQSLSAHDKNDYVGNLQRSLMELGYLGGTVDGDFGTHTDNAIRDFQKDHKLKVDGIVGSETKTALFNATHDVYDAAANQKRTTDEYQMERWRNLTNDWKARQGRATTDETPTTRKAPGRLWGESKR